MFFQEQKEHTPLCTGNLLALSKAAALSLTEEENGWSTRGTAWGMGVSPFTTSPTGPGLCGLTSRQLLRSDVKRLNPVWLCLVGETLDCYFP